jgi:hypothetical protein
MSAIHLSSYSGFKSTFSLLLERGASVQDLSEVRPFVDRVGLVVVGCLEYIYMLHINGQIYIYNNISYMHIYTHVINVGWYECIALCFSKQSRGAT